MNDIEKLGRVFVGMGADNNQARRMAAQLLKRADQLMAERRISQLDAVDYLLRLATSGAQGIPPPGFEGVAGADLVGAAVGQIDDETVDAGRPGNGIGIEMRNRVNSLFTGTFGYEPSVICRAPGRVEFVGNHTDYNGGPVLGAAVDHGVWVAVALRKDRAKRFRSDQSDQIVEVSDASMPQEGESSWVNYPLGVLDALSRFDRLGPDGFDYAVCADLPVGAGLSSSAAIELSSALAFLTLTGQSVEREELVKIGRYAENNFVGVPCGILDQGVSGFGRKNQLVFIDCAGPRFETVPMPAGTNFWIFNTHTKHALVDGLYSARHRECLAAAKGLGVAYLAEADEALLASRGADLAPVELQRARHIVGETQRVHSTIEALKAGNLAEVGRLLTASHRSSQMNFENSTPELDFLVDTLESVDGVFGARLTGGGFGGAVMAFTDEAFDESSASEVRASYLQKFGAEPKVYHLKTADGAEVIQGLSSRA